MSHFVTILLKHLQKEFIGVEVFIIDLGEEEKKKTDLLKGRRAITLDIYSQITAIPLRASPLFGRGGEDFMGIVQDIFR